MPFILYFIFLLFALIFIIIDIYFHKNNKTYRESNKKTYIINFAFIFIGFLIALIAIDTTKENIRQNREKKESCEKILNIDKVLSQNFSAYKEQVDAILNFGEKEKNKIEPGFPFERLIHLWDRNYIYDFRMMLYKSYFVTQDKILHTVTEAIFNIDFKYYQELQNLFIAYYDEIKESNQSEVLNDFNLLIDLPNFSETFKVEKEIINNYKNSQDCKANNTIYKYCKMYDLIDYNLKFIQGYTNIIKNLECNR